MMIKSAEIHPLYTSENTNRCFLAKQIISKKRYPKNKKVKGW